MDFLSFVGHPCALRNDNLNFEARGLALEQLLKPAAAVWCGALQSMWPNVTVLGPGLHVGLRGGFFWIIM